MRHGFDSAEDELLLHEPEEQVNLEAAIKEQLKRTRRQAIEEAGKRLAAYEQLVESPLFHVYLEDVNKLAAKELQNLDKTTDPVSLAKCVGKYLALLQITTLHENERLSLSNFIAQESQNTET